MNILLVNDNLIILKIFESISKKIRAEVTQNPNLIGVMPQDYDIVIINDSVFRSSMIKTIKEANADIKTALLIKRGSKHNPSFDFCIEKPFLPAQLITMLKTAIKEHLPEASKLSIDNNLEDIDDVAPKVDDNVDANADISVNDLDAEEEIPDLDHLPQSFDDFDDQQDLGLDDLLGGSDALNDEELKNDSSIDELDLGSQENIKEDINLNQENSDDSLSKDTQENASDVGFEVNDAITEDNQSAKKSLEENNENSADLGSDVQDDTLSEDSDELVFDESNQDDVDLSNIGIQESVDDEFNSIDGTDNDGSSFELGEFDNVGGKDSDNADSDTTSLDLDNLDDSHIDDSDTTVQDENILDDNDELKIDLENNKNDLSADDLDNIDLPVVSDDTELDNSEIGIDDIAQSAYLGSSLESKKNVLDSEQVDELKKILDDDANELPTGLGDNTVSPENKADVKKQIHALSELLESPHLDTILEGFDLNININFTKKK